ncbi:MAG: SUMF1/EgtB/PvdO family nonheme iron enzyme [Planctomycetota bacterium]|nr:SUMF1/EgtB/PvdO family nonheme iron enzyme [Planctomycetota bacterium]
MENPVPEHSDNQVPTPARGDAGEASGRDFDWAVANAALRSIGASPDWQSRYDLGDAQGVPAAGEGVSAHDTRFDRPVVIRRITEQTAKQETNGLALIKAIRTRAAVRHQNIVGIVDYGHDLEGVYVVAEAVSGKGVSELLETGPLELSAASNVVFQLCDALEKLDSQGIAVRTLRPEHVVLAETGCLKLVGFGWGSGFADSQVQADKEGGYRPPEHRGQAEESDGRAQVWSLAAFLVHLLTGELPATGDFSQERLLETIEVSVCGVLAKALQANPEQRYSAVSEFQSALQGACDDQLRKAADVTHGPRGTCRCCGEINQVDRAFCVACGEKLREACLGCDTDNEVWAQYCGKCGCQLEELIGRRQCEIEHQKRSVESARRDYDYQQALERVGPLLLIQHGRLTNVHDWAVQMRQTLQAEAAQQQAWVKLLHEEAAQAMQTEQYDEARKALDQIPHALRSDEALLLLREVSGQLDQADHLLQQIEDAIVNRKLSGLWRYTEKYLTLCPADPAITRLHESVQCHQHEDAALAAEIVLRAQQAFAAAEYGRALAVLEELSAGEQQVDSVQQLRTMAKNRTEQVEDLKGAMSGTDDVHELLDLVDALLEIQPNDQMTQELRDDLLEEVALVDRQISSRHRQKVGILAMLLVVGIVMTTAMGWVWSSADRTDQAASFAGAVTAADVSPRQNRKSRAADLKRKKTAVVVAAVNSEKNGPTTTTQETGGEREGMDSSSAINGASPVTPATTDEGNVAEGDGLVEVAAVGRAGDVETPSVSVQGGIASAPFSAQQAAGYQQAWADAFKVPVALTNSIGLKLRLVPAGKFLMGSALDVADRGQDESQHEVVLSTPYYLGVYEVTQGQYEQVMGKNDSKFRGPDRPVEQVSWNDAVSFCERLSALPAEKAAGHVYRLPTEAEWEYACRAGTVTPYNAGESIGDLSDAAWFNGNAEATQPVGQKNPNAFGLFDMAGNVWEWCQDRYGPYANEQARDPQGPLSGSERVNRGGSWINLPQVCRSARRSRFSAERSYTVLGFRVLCLPVDR